MVINRFLNEILRFNQEITQISIPEKPTQLSSEAKTWAILALREELNEFEEAKALDDEIDALIDLTYFALGRIIEMGVLPGVAFDEVHDANMNKKRGNLTKRPGRNGHDAVKPKDWRPPNLLPYLQLTKKQIVNYWALSHIKQKPKILIIGYGRHGKDLVANILKEYFLLTYKPTSLVCAEKILLPFFNKSSFLPTYETAEDCYEDRRGNTKELSHRELWYREIQKYNRDDKTRLARYITDRYDIYCGMRCERELIECKNNNMFNHIIWVDRSKHEPIEDEKSCTVKPHMANYIINSNGSKIDLTREVFKFWEFINERNK